MEESPVFTTDVTADLQRQIDELKQQLGQFNPRSLGAARESASTRKVILSTTAILGEDVSNGEGLRLGIGSNIDDFHTESQTVSDDFTVIAAWNDSGAGVRRVAQSFKVIGNLDELLKSVILRFDGAASTATFIVDLCSDSSGAPGSVIASTATNNTLGNGQNLNLTFTFASSQTITHDVTYWLVCRSTTLPGSPSTNSIRHSNGTDEYLAGNISRSTNSGVSWTPDTTEDLYFTLNFVDTAGRIYKSSAVTAAVAATFIGVADAAGTKGSTPEVTHSGTKSDFTGLTGGAVYYVTDTRGALGGSPGTVTKRAGVALDTTNMVILAT